MRCILVPTAPGFPPKHRLDAALNLARRTRSHLTVLFVRPDPVVAGASIEDLVPDAPPDIATIEQNSRVAAAEAKAAFELWCEERDVDRSSDRLDATFASWREETGDLAALIALIGRVSDLIVVDGGAPMRPLAASALDAALFASGRPTLVVGQRVPGDLLRHVLIAWNASLECTRVVAQSISLLQRAERVSVFIGSEPNRERALSDLSAYLRWHGVIAELALSPDRAHTSVGETLLATCRKCDATLLLMGAYTHSRIREMFLGGVTQHVLANASLPVLLAH
jgi:nucleotide-binding universal stress UspA family protein